MARIINPEHKRKVSDKDEYKLGKHVSDVKGVALINGKEQTGLIVY